MRWESLFFLCTFALLALQVMFFVKRIQFVNPHDPIAFFANLEKFIEYRFSYVVTPAFVVPLVYLLFSPSRAKWKRVYLDCLAVYLVCRLVIQFLVLNTLVFNHTSSPGILITQLLIFLPYSLLIWGWIYWRLDVGRRDVGAVLFRLDHEGDAPRVLDYFVASFSSVFSASISGIKGSSTGARILILLHGFMIYDVMGLTLSRAVSLVQNSG